MRIGVIAIFVAAVIGGMIYLGLISTNDVKATGRRAVADVKKVRKEIAAPLAGPEQQEVQAARQCQNTLKRLESAKRAVAGKTGQATGAVSWDRVLEEMGSRRTPVCPSGGSYLLNNLGTVASCSVGGRGTATHQDDHEIQGF